MARLRRISTVAVSVLLVGGVSLAITAKSDGTTTSENRSKCPARPVPPLYGEHDEVVAAARRLLIQGSMSAQAHTTKLTAKNSPVLAVVILARTAVPIPGAAALRAEAARRCGSETAQASWAVTIGVPAALATSSMRTAFLLKTKAGWRTY